MNDDEYRVGEPFQEGNWWVVPVSEQRMTWHRTNIAYETEEQARAAYEKWKEER